MFRTKHPTQPGKFKITHQENIFLMGSCFAQNIGNRMQGNKFHAHSNPFGIIFNPMSIVELFDFALKGSEFPKDTYVENESIWFNYKVHSEYSGLDKGVLENKVNRKLETVCQQLKRADLFIFTLGTAWVYELKHNGMLVANCHRVPQSRFNKRLLSMEEVVHGFEQLLQMLKKNRPNLKCVLTVSPVRHIKDTIPLNMVSKSVLRLACHQLQETHPEVDYFPAYELLIDDLRDYRFYEKDMLHPNELAQEYIWEHFSQTYFDQATLQFLGSWKKIRSALDHRPFHPASAKHQTFLRQTLEKLETYGHTLDVSKEIAILRSQIIEN